MFVRVTVQGTEGIPTAALEPGEPHSFLAQKAAECLRPARILSWPPLRRRASSFFYYLLWEVSCQIRTLALRPLRTSYLSTTNSNNRKVCCLGSLACLGRGSFGLCQDVVSVALGTHSKCDRASEKPAVVGAHDWAFWRLAVGLLFVLLPTVLSHGWLMWTWNLTIQYCSRKKQRDAPNEEDVCSWAHWVGHMEPSGAVKYSVVDSTFHPPEHAIPCET